MNRKSFSFFLSLVFALSLLAADKKITDLNYLGNASFSPSDLLYIADVSANELKKTQLSDFDTRYLTVGTKQNANLIYAGPASGVSATPSFRSLVALDIPSFDASKVTTGKASLSTTTGGVTVTGTNALFAAATVNVATATASQPGLLASSDWTTFNAKQSVVLTTKGDLFTRTSSSDTRLAVGSNNTVLTADSSTPSGMKWASASAGSFASPIVTTYTSGSGTFTVSGTPLFIRVRMVGGGGGGGAGQGGASGSNGSTTSFNSIVANGGIGGVGGQGNGNTGVSLGGAGGTGTAYLRLAGGTGFNGGLVSGGGTGGAAGNGGPGAPGAFGNGGVTAAGGISAIANSGGGGGGAFSTSNGGGGGGGEYVEFIITSPSGTYSYAVGAGGAGGTGAQTGGTGGSGFINATQYYQ